MESKYAPACGAPHGYYALIFGDYPDNIQQTAAFWDGNSWGGDLKVIFYDGPFASYDEAEDYSRDELMTMFSNLFL